ncbi:MAG: HAD family hydrolase [Elainellaceae cyanobacterium]
MHELRVLAADYDGTLATNGVVDEMTLAALQRWKDSGRQLILITGRQFDDLLNTFSALDLFDLVVPENGAMLYHPGDRSEKLLAAPPPQIFVEQLRDRIFNSQQPQAVTGEFSALVNNQGLEWLGIGRVIVSTWVPHDETVRALIDELNLDLHIIMNKRAVMVLPQGISKESGLNAALAELDLLPNTVVGVGDAENDADFLKLCGYSVAVANALPSLKAEVDGVTQHHRGEGVAELIEQILSTSS